MHQACMWSSFPPTAHVQQPARGLAASTLWLSPFSPGCCIAIFTATSVACPAQHGAWPVLTTQPLYVCGFNAARCCLKNSLSFGRLLRRSQKH